MSKRSWYWDALIKNFTTCSERIIRSRSAPYQWSKWNRIPTKHERPRTSSLGSWWPSEGEGRKLAFGWGPSWNEWVSRWSLTSSVQSSRILQSSNVRVISPVRLTVNLWSENQGEPNSSISVTTLKRCPISEKSRKRSFQPRTEKKPTTRGLFRTITSFFFSSCSISDVVSPFFTEDPLEIYNLGKPSPHDLERRWHASPIGSLVGIISYARAGTMSIVKTIEPHICCASLSRWCILYYKPTLGRSL